MDTPDPAGAAALPKHILDVWIIVLIILATILIMTALVLCPATAVIIYRASSKEWKWTVKFSLLWSPSCWNASEGRGKTETDVASGCAFGDLAVSIGDRARPSCTADVQLAPASPLSEICLKTLWSSGFFWVSWSRGARAAPACWLHLVLLPIARVPPHPSPGG
ncbi:small integral membrane protein 3 [Phaenicophaeus curvirostris]|uniref:small integral membrane protein 3 n=1 Tax=Phaenicophaeus curvirostris TaxID=33595 RepID=UPI0037F09A34